MEKYKPLVDKNVVSLFNDYVDSLNIPFIDYFAMGVQDVLHRNSTSLMSNLDWQKTFKTNQFSEHDPLRLAVLDTQRNFICFKDIDHINSLGSEIMNQRKKHFISDGIVIVDRRLSHNYMMTLATNYTKFEAADFYLKNYASIHKIFADFISMIQPGTKEYTLVKPNS